MSTSENDSWFAFAPSRGLAAGLDYAAASHGRASILLIVFALIAFLPGFFQIPPVDRDEARFAQATKQMLETGEYIDIHFQDEVRYKKPVGIYWLQAAAVKAGEAAGIPHARTTIWLYRLPSLFGAIGAVLLTYWAALAFVTRRTALLAALMMASSILLGVEARLAKTDAVLLATCVAAMGAMARIYLAGRRTPETKIGWREPAILWTALGLGVLIKGPLILMFVALTALTLSIADRSARWLWSLRPVTGFIWMIVLVLPWFAAIVAKSGGSFFTHAVGDDMLAKVFGGQESHGAPPGYLFRAVLGHVLAGRGSGRACRAHGVAVAARAGRAISAGLADAIMARVRSGDHQAAALRAAALSGHRDPDRGDRRRRRAGARTLAHARHGRLVPVSGGDRDFDSGRQRADRPQSRSHRLAVRGRRGYLRTVRLVAL